MSDDTGLNVVIVDDHLALRRGLELLLRHHGHHVVGVADDAEQARGIIERRRPHVAVIDLELPGENGADLTSQLLAEHDWLHVLLYTGVVDAESLSAAMDCGATGFALKSGDPSELLTALGAVAEGRGFVDERIRRVLLGRETTDRIAALSEREREVL